MKKSRRLELAQQYKQEMDGLLRQMLEDKKNSKITKALIENFFKKLGDDTDEN